MGAELTPTSHPLSLSGQKGLARLQGPHPSPAGTLSPTSFHASWGCKSCLSDPWTWLQGTHQKAPPAQHRKPWHRGPCYLVTERNAG